jgi:hypothetical protein
MTNLQLYRGESEHIVIDIDERTILTKKLMEADTIVCATISNLVLDIAIGDYVTYGGENYTINRLPDVEKLNSNTYRYNITFESDFSILHKKLYISTDGLTEFAYNGTAEDFVDLFLTNINSIYPTWTKGEIADTDYFTMEFSNEYCDEALVRVAEHFKLEFNIVSREITMIPAIGTTTALSFEYGRGKGLYKLTRQQVQDQNILTRVYGYGGDKNIDYTYRSGSKKLVFENAGVRYLEKNVATYGVIEGQFTDENVYPQRTSTLTSVDINFLPSNVFDENTSYLIDSTMDFDLNDYLLEGQTAKIVFKTGDLAGLSCEIWKYEHATKKFWIKLYLDPEDDYPYPNYNGGTPIAPQVGDSYTLVDITMPQSYIDTAEALLKSKTQDFIDQNSIPQVVYSIDIDPRYAKEIAAFTVGDKVTIVDTDLGINNLIRISAIEFPLVQPYKIKATIADFIPYTLPERIVKTIVEEKKETRFTKINQHRNARIATQQQKQLKDLIFDTDNYFDVDNIRPLSIETMYLAVGTKSSNFNLENVVIQCNYGGDANAVAVSGGNLAHLEMEITGLGSVWVIGSGISVSSLTPAIPYYLYAKCSESALTGEWVLSDSKITVQQVAGYYHFYVGNLFAVTSGRRDFDFVKGMTYIVGDTIKSGKIQDLTGDNYFDLTNGKFKIGNATTSLDYNVTTANTLTLKGALVQSSAGTFPIIRFCGAYNASTTYSKGDQVTYGGASWNYINNTPASGKTPAEGAYWTAAALKGVKGDDGGNGTSSAPITLYKRSATVPAMPTGTFTYTFATGVLSGGTINGWSQAWPADDGNPCWVIYANASAATDTVSITAGQFTDPPIEWVKSGINTAPVKLYQRKATAPAKPTDWILYTFSTKTVSDPLSVMGDWSTALPTSNGLPLYVINAMAASRTDTDTINPGDWSEPSIETKDGAAGTNARVVNLTLGKQGFTYDTNGEKPSPVNTTVTATARNTTGTVYYQFFLNDISQGARSTTNTFTYYPPALYSDMPQKIEVQISEGADTTVLASDQITTVGLKAGANAITIVLTNDSHACPVEDDVIDYTGSGTDIMVWEGTTQLTPDIASPYANSTFRVTAVDDTNITVGAQSVVGNVIRYAASSAMTQRTATIDFTIVVKNSAGVESTFHKIQSISKSLQGVAGEDGKDGKTGALPVPRGDFSANTIYYNNDYRRDVVLYGGLPYLCKDPNAASGASGAWNEANWEQFGATFANVATDLLFVGGTAYIDKLGVRQLQTNPAMNVKRTEILNDNISVYGQYGDLKYVITGGSIDGATVDDTYDITDLGTSYDFDGSFGGNWGSAPTGFPASGVLATIEITNEGNEVYFPSMDFEAGILRISGTVSTYYGMKVGIILDNETIESLNVARGLTAEQTSASVTIPAFTRNLSVGTHYLTFHITYAMSSGASPCTLRAYWTIGGNKVDNDILYPATSILAADGAIIRKSATEYLMCDFRNSAQFTIRSGNYGLRVESTGITYTANGTDYTSLI